MPLLGPVGDALFRQQVVRRNVGLVGSCSRFVLHQGTNGIGRSIGIVNLPESIYLGVQKLGVGMPWKCEELLRSRLAKMQARGGSTPDPAGVRGRSNSASHWRLDWFVSGVELVSQTE